ncbi:DELTA-stichotoxin-Hcr4a-like [Sphaeramia orbicularis]|uniref:DELTA-stichotoxin-Hcr4a-like n=1 Tax=Sphaeramia orbicularis TaxID=375764 RepID=A0A672ZPA2_9TELE|nr:DELTA-stichotoxin-Hcr4a-like [Sphaeramia orbicularis]
MSESAEHVAANLKSRRNVTIEFINVTSKYCLINPKVYLESGQVHVPPQPTVRPFKTEVCNFSKTSAKTSGAVGVLTYDLYHQLNGTAERLAIMFSVPYDYNLYKNWFAVGIYGKDRECDEGLYKEMYYSKDQRSFVREEAVGSTITCLGRQVDVKAAMSPMERAIMKVEVWDKLFREMEQQHM